MSEVLDPLRVVGIFAKSRSDLVVTQSLRSQTQHTSLNGSQPRSWRHDPPGNLGPVDDPLHMSLTTLEAAGYVCNRQTLRLQSQNPALDGPESMGS